MTAILCDLDGVLYQGDTVIPGAVEVVSWLEEKHIPHLFLTNTTSRPRSALVAKLAGFGIKTQMDDYLTPPVAAIQLLLANNRHRLAVFAPIATQDEFSAFKIIDHTNSDTIAIDAVVVGDLAEKWDFTTLNRCFNLLMNNPQAMLIALGMTRYWRSTTGLQLDAGPFVKALEYATGRTAIVTGKPAANFYRAAIDALGDHDHIYMIGDDIRGDIEAAQAAGLTALLVRTGKFTSNDLYLDILPDAILTSIADLPNWWHTHVD